MRLLANIKHDSINEAQGRLFKRRASRGIVMNGENILLLYTRRYNDFSFPGGGVDDHEDLRLGLRRELEEETGARNIKIIKEFGYIDELRPHYLPEYDLIHMLSYFYECDIGPSLGEAKMENYELANGMEARWVNIFEALKHNQNMINSNDASMGLSIKRETLVLSMVAQELVLRTD